MGYNEDIIASFDYKINFEYQSGFVHNPVNTGLQDENLLADIYSPFGNGIASQVRLRLHLSWDKPTLYQLRTKLGVELLTGPSSAIS